MRVVRSFTRKFRVLNKKTIEVSYRLMVDVPSMLIKTVTNDYENRNYHV